MTNKERIDKYIKEQCINCINKNTNLCEIRVFTCNNTIHTRCVYYKRSETKHYKK